MKILRRLKNFSTKLNKKQLKIKLNQLIEYHIKSMKELQEKKWQQWLLEEFNTALEGNISELFEKRYGVVCPLCKLYNYYEGVIDAYKNVLTLLEDENNVNISLSIKKERK